MTSNEKPSVTKRVQLRFIVLLPLIIVCALVARAHIVSVGGTYEMLIDSYPGVPFTEENITIAPEGMLKVASVTQDAEGLTHVVFEAGEPGSGMCLVGTESSGVMFEMACSEDGVVVADGFEVTGWEAAFAAIVIVVAAIGILCVTACNALGREAWFGYEMAAYAGGAIFFIAQAISFVALYLMGEISSLSTLAMTITQMANNFVVAAILPMAIICFFVSASNAQLLRREGVGFTNMLGVVWSLLWGLALLGLWVFRNYVVDLFTNFYLVTFVDSAISAIVAYGVALFLGTCTTALLAARHVPAFARDYLIILGCGLRADGTLTPLLAGRVDAARGYAKRQVEAGYSAPAFVPSGGQGPDEACAEAEAMGRYIEENEDSPRILLEARSTTTRENMAFSEEVIAADWATADRGAAASEPAVAFATTNYHVLRGYVFAHEAGMRAEGIAAPTKLYFWPNAFLREFVGMLAARALPIVMTCLAIVALYLVAEYLLILS